MKYEDLPRDGAGGIVPEKVEWPVQIALLRPVEQDGEKLESLDLREPTAVDIELCWGAGGEIPRVIHLLAQLGSVSPEQVRSLKAVDFMRATRLVGAFL